jgi:hypothetical protein
VLLVALEEQLIANAIPKANAAEEISIVNYKFLA